MTTNTQPAAIQRRLELQRQHERLQGNVKILSAINELREAISSCEFHGRDYYIQDLEAVDVDAFSMAYDERRKHLNNIGDFEQYIEKHIEHIVTQ